MIESMCCFCSKVVFVLIILPVMSCQEKSKETTQTQYDRSGKGCSCWKTGNQFNMQIRQEILTPFYVRHVCPYIRRIIIGRLEKKCNLSCYRKKEVDFSNLNLMESFW